MDDVHKRNRFFREILADPGKSRDLNAAVNGVILILAVYGVLLVEIVNVMFVSDEIGDDRFELDRRRVGERTSADMGSYAYVEDVGKIGDLLGFRDTASIAVSGGRVPWHYETLRSTAVRRSEGAFQTKASEISPVHPAEDYVPNLQTISTPFAEPRAC